MLPLLIYNANEAICQTSQNCRPAIRQNPGESLGLGSAPPNIHSIHRHELLGPVFAIPLASQPVDLLVAGDEHPEQPQNMGLSARKGEVDKPGGGTLVAAALPADRFAGGAAGRPLAVGRDAAARVQPPAAVGAALGVAPAHGAVAAGK